MKMKFLASTALVSVSLLGSGTASAAEWEVTLGGYMNQYVGFASTDTFTGETIADVDVQEDAEIHFLPSITLDNGIKFGVDVQLESETDADQIDESFLFVRGTFGEVVLGNNDGAAYAMHYGVRTMGIGIDAGDAGNWILDQSGVLTGTGNFDNIDDDSTKIRFISPRFAGLQIGVSYAPEGTQDDDAFPTEAKNHLVAPEGVTQAAINYNRTLGEVELGVSAGLEMVGDGNGITGDSFWMAAGGVSLDFGNISLSGAFSYESDPTPIIDDRKNIGGSIGYAQGPIGVSLGAIYGFSDSPAGDDKQLTIELGANYALGPGVAAIGSIYYGDRDSAGVEAKGFAVVGGIALTF